MPWDATWHLVQHVLGAFAANDAIGDRVGLLLVSVSGPTDTVLELDFAALLDDVGRLVGRGVQIGWTGEGDLVSGRVSFRADVGGGIGRSPADMGLRAAEIVPAEGGLD